MAVYDVPSMDRSYLGHGHGVYSYFGYLDFLERFSAGA